jgi:hypothetical protein
MSISIQDPRVIEGLDLASEFAVLQEWEYIQQRLLISICALSPSPALSWRQVIDQRSRVSLLGTVYGIWDKPVRSFLRSSF